MNAQPSGSGAPRDTAALMGKTRRFRNRQSHRRSDGVRAAALSQPASMHDFLRPKHRATRSLARRRHWPGSRPQAPGSLRFAVPALRIDVSRFLALLLPPRRIRRSSAVQWPGLRHGGLSRRVECRSEESYITVAGLSWEQDLGCRSPNLPQATTPTRLRCGKPRGRRSSAKRSLHRNPRPRTLRRRRLRPRS